MISFWFFFIFLNFILFTFVLAHLSLVYFFHLIRDLLFRIFITSSEGNFNLNQFFFAWAMLLSFRSLIRTKKYSSFILLTLTTVFFPLFCRSSVHKVTCTVRMNVYAFKTEKEFTIISNIQKS